MQDLGLGGDTELSRFNLVYGQIHRSHDYSYLNVDRLPATNANLRRMTRFSFIVLT